MKTKGLHTSALDTIDPNQLTRTHTVEGAEFLPSSVPTNAEILESAKEVYEKHKHVADTHYLWCEMV